MMNEVNSNMLIEKVESLLSIDDDSRLPNIEDKAVIDASIDLVQQTLRYALKSDLEKQYLGKRGSDNVTLLNHVTTNDNQAVFNSAALYSSSATLLCKDLEKSILENKVDIKATHSINELRNLDLKTSVSLVDSMSERIEVEVQKTLNANIKTLVKDFDSNHNEDLNPQSDSFTSIQNIGNTILRKERLMSKVDHEISEGGKLFEVVVTEKDADIQALEDKIRRLKSDVSIYRQELEKIRPDSEVIMMLCNSVKIDPAIATVQHLLEILRTVHNQHDILMAEAVDRNEKLYQTTEALSSQHEITRELKDKLKSTEVEDDRRIEMKVDDICQYYEQKIQKIHEELESRDVSLHEDFWVPHSSTLTDRLTEISKHTEDVAEAELRREVSLAGTDKFSDDEQPAIPIIGLRRPTVTTIEYFEDDNSLKSEDTLELQSNGTIIQTRTCALQ